jgi:hypothetical protein
MSFEDPCTLHVKFYNPVIPSSVCKPTMIYLLRTLEHAGEFESVKEDKLVMIRYLS